MAYFHGSFTSISLAFVKGKLEADIELLTKEEATEKAAGEGQDEPNANPHLDKPKYVLHFQVLAF